MSVGVVIKLAPLYTLERHNDPRWNQAGRVLYEPGALRFPPGRSTVPLVVDHDEERQVGVVDSLFRGEWTDGPWLFASATVTDPPGWLRKHDTKASLGFHPFGRRSYTEAETVSGALVREVSLLSPSALPAEPLARVERVWELEPAKKPAGRATPSPAAPSHSFDVPADLTRDERAKLVELVNSGTPPDVLARLLEDSVRARQLVR